MADPAAPLASSSPALDGVHQAVVGMDAFAATESFGVVALVVLLVLLAERDRLRIIGASPRRVTVVTAFAAPLLVIFLIVVGVRIAELLN